MEWELADQTVELRYSGGYLHWDRAGKTALDLIAQFPTLTVDQASPAQVGLAAKAELVTMVYGVDSAGVTAAKPYSGSDQLLDFAADFFTIVIRNLNIKTLSRVGHRSIHHSSLKTKEEAQARIQQFAQRRNVGAELLNQTKDPILSAKSLTELTVRFEDQKTGLSLSIKTAETAYNVTGPTAGLLRPHLPPNKHFIRLDIDAYTREPMPSSDLITDELVKSNLKMVRTRLMPLLD